MHITRLLLPAVAALTLSGCAISSNVTPVTSTTSIEKIYVLENERVHMEGLLDELVQEISAIGFAAESYRGDRPIDARHYLTYTANWNWDMAMYLTYFRATLFEDGKVLGEVEYDAKMGGMSFSKFGRTADKIRPLMEELLANVQRPTMLPKAGS